MRAESSGKALMRGLPAEGTLRKLRSHYAGESVSSTIREIVTYWQPSTYDADNSHNKFLDLFSYF